MVTIKYKEGLNKDFFEQTAWQKGGRVCGIDESGRGAMAGPLVCAAVILPLGSVNEDIQDSKLLTKKELIKAYQWIHKYGKYSYCVVDVSYIDTYNIYQATLYGMRRAFMQLLAVEKSILPCYVLVDAMPVSLHNTPYENIDVFYFNYAESISISVAAASIVAKVKRDEIMECISVFFPRYHLKDHKGYCTKKHCHIVQQSGESIIHRKVYVTGKAWSYGQANQLLLFDKTSLLKQE